MSAQVLHPETTDSPDPGTGVNQRPQDRPVPQSVDILRLNRGEEPAGLLDTRLGRSALAERVAYPPNEVAVSRSPELSLGLALQRLREFRVAVAAPDGAFCEIGLPAQSCQAQRPSGGIDARRQAGDGQTSA